MIGRGEKVSRRCGIRFPTEVSVGCEANLIHALSTTLGSSNTDIDTKRNESNIPHITSLTICFPRLIINPRSLYVFGSAIFHVESGRGRKEKGEGDENGI